MPRKVLVNLLSFTGTRGGTETYAKEIVRRLPESMPDTEFVALTNRLGAPLIRAFFPGRVVELSAVGEGRIAWPIAELLATPRLARRIDADVVWSPANLGPITSRIVHVTTTHDVTYHRRSGGSPVARVTSAVTAWMISRAARTATLVITGSRAAEQDLVDVIGLDPERITVIPHGTKAPSSESVDMGVLDDLGVPGERDLVLTTGNRLPHKNFDGLLRAIALIDPSRRPAVVITGGGQGDPLRQVVADLGLSDDVILPGWVSIEQLEALYARADLYVCPSLNEGFGLPVIDAMRRGCLVLANDIPVLREVGGDVVGYADARDPGALSLGIVEALAHSPDPARSERGRVWASQFTWERSAEQTAAVLLRAIERGSSRT